MDRIRNRWDRTVTTPNNTWFFKAPKWAYWFGGAVLAAAPLGWVFWPLLFVWSGICFQWDRSLILHLSAEQRFDLLIGEARRWTARSGMTVVTDNNNNNN